MANSFTHYWRNDTWESHRRFEGEPLDRIAGNGFVSRGVKVGDRIYVITNLHGRLYLAARMEVGEFLSHQAAKHLFGEDVWEAREHLVARNGTSLHFSRPVPDLLARKLRFGDDKPLAYTQEGGIDPQTLRGVRKLTPESAALFDELLARPVLEASSQR